MGPVKMLKEKNMVKGMKINPNILLPLLRL